MASPFAEKLTGAVLIAKERQRQIETLGWTAQKDDAQDDSQLLECAIHIADDVYTNRDVVSSPMPNFAEWTMERAWKVIEKYKSDHISRLVIAGALIAAEIDRLVREMDREAK